MIYASSQEEYLSVPDYDFSIKLATYICRWNLQIINEMEYTGTIADPYKDRKDGWIHTGNLMENSEQ